MSERTPPVDLYETMGLERIVAVEPAGRAVLEYRATPAQCHSGGVVQGGFAPTRPGLVVAEAWVVQGGRRTAFVEGTLKDAAGTLLAKASSTITMASRAKVEAAARAALGK